MNFTFFHRPEPRKFKYKPRFYTPEEEQAHTSEGFHPDKFANKLHNSWSKKRRASAASKSSNIRTVVWIAFLILILGVLLVKLF